jgi:hypothetical protein
MRKSTNKTPKQSKPRAAADTPPAAPVTAEQATEELNALLAQMPDIPSLTQQERAVLRKHGRLPEAEVQASVNVVGSSDRVAQAVGQPADDVRQLLDDTGRWTAVENVLKGMLKSVADANLVRRKRATVIAIQAYGIGQLLARDPENAAVVPHVEEMKRLKALRRRKPATSPTQTPAPGAPQQAAATGASPASDASTTPKE